MRTTVPLIALFLIVHAGLSKAGETATPETLKHRASYAYGYQYGVRIKSSLLELDADALAEGIRDAIAGAPTRMSMPQMPDVIVAYQDEMALARANQALENRTRGKTFLTDNRDRADVTELDSGLQYEIVKTGDGPVPKAGDTVAIHYRGTSIDGREFDSSYARDAPHAAPLTQLIEGLREAIILMPRGSVWKVYVPAEMAYGAEGAGTAVGPDETLIFDVELIAIKGD